MAAIDLTGSAALITGGATRVGASIARALGHAGCDVLIHYATNETGARTVQAELHWLGRRAEVARADLTDRGQLQQLAERALSFSGGSLGVLVHNAANFERVPPERLNAEAWDRAMSLNAAAPYLLTLPLVPALVKARGAVIAIACISAERPWKNYIPYSVSKASVVALVRGLALGLAPDVRVNAIAPGAVLQPKDYDEEQLDAVRATVPLGQLGSAEDVARAVVFLAQNDYITGQVLAIDGGKSLI